MSLAAGSNILGFRVLYATLIGAVGWVVFALVLAWWFTGCADSSPIDDRLFFDVEANPAADNLPPLLSGAYSHFEINCRNLRNAVSSSLTADTPLGSHANGGMCREQGGGDEIHPTKADDLAAVAVVRTLFVVAAALLAGG